MIHRAGIAAVSFFIAAGLVACGDAPPPVAGIPPGTGGVKAPLPASTDVVAAVPVGPVSLPVRVGFRMLTRPVPGVPVTLGLTVTSAESLEGLDILASSPDLRMEGQSTQLAISPVEAGRSYELNLMFTPAQAGIADIDLEVRARSTGGQSPMRFAVPVLVESPEKSGG